MIVHVGQDRRSGVPFAWRSRMLRDEYRNHYNETMRTKLEEIATDCATAIAVITPRILAPENAWARRSHHGRDQRPVHLRVADAS